MRTLLMKLRRIFACRKLTRAADAQLHRAAELIAVARPRVKRRPPAAAAR